MSKIRIKNFGPIKEGFLENEGWIEIKKLTVFIGNQGSGKSTIAKVISSLTWLEKAINRGDVNKTEFSKNTLYDVFKYQRIKNYFKPDTEIEYDGDRMTFKLNKSSKYPEITIKENHSYHVPKIMYVPAERNFLSVVKNAFGIKNLPDTLYTFAEELRKGQINLKDRLLELPIGNLKYEYNDDGETSILIGEGFKTDLLESSSGYQSLVPLFLVTKFLSDELKKGKNVLREQLNVDQSVRRNNEITQIMLDDTLDISEKSRRVVEIDGKYLNTCFINIVEEPEQNLFPSSQFEILKSLLSANNQINENKIILTTHSPYLINYLSLSIYGAYLQKKIYETNNPNILLKKLKSIIPENALISESDVAIYQLDERNGTISKLPNLEGIPSNKNSLNQSLKHGNEMFDALLEIEEEL